MPETLTAEEKELARELWDMSADYRRSAETMRAFRQASQRVCDAIDGATQQPQHRDPVCKNPFSH